MNRSERKVALVTGASGGLGGALCRQLAQEGWQVVAGARTGQVSVSHEFIIPAQLDVTDSLQVASVVGGALTRFGRIDLLVNNAGLTADAPCAQMTEGDWDRVLDVNLRGAFLCAKAVACPMARQRDGHIINISSFGARSGPRGQGNYAAAKAGLIGLTHSLAKELGSRNVRVNVVFPGVLRTNMTAGMSAEQLAALASANTLGRINSLDEVVRFISFLASTQNISGQVFPLDSRVAPWT